MASSTTPQLPTPIPIESATSETVAKSNPAPSGALDASPNSSTIDKTVVNEKREELSQPQSEPVVATSQQSLHDIASKELLALTNSYNKETFIVYQAKMRRLCDGASDAELQTAVRRVEKLISKLESSKKALQKAKEALESARAKHEEQKQKQSENKAARRGQKKEATEKAKVASQALKKLEKASAKSDANSKKEQAKSEKQLAKAKQVAEKAGTSEAQLKEKLAAAEKKEAERIDKSKEEWKALKQRVRDAEAKTKDTEKAIVQAKETEKELRQLHDQVPAMRSEVSSLCKEMLIKNNWLIEKKPSKYSAHEVVVSILSRGFAIKPGNVDQEQLNLLLEKSKLHSRVIYYWQSQKTAKSKKVIEYVGQSKGQQGFFGRTKQHILAAADPSTSDFYTRLSARIRCSPASIWTVVPEKDLGPASQNFRKRVFHLNELDAEESSSIYQLNTLYPDGLNSELVFKTSVGLKGALQGAFDAQLEEAHKQAAVDESSNSTAEL